MQAEYILAEKPSMIDLKKFCASVIDERLWLRVPYHHEGNWYAGDGNIAIRMGAETFGEAVEASGPDDHVSQLFGPRQLAELFAKQKDED